MIEQERFIKEVLRILSVLAEYLETAGRLNLNDGSVISENLCEKLLNKTYGYDLQNINLIKQNAAVVDLYDKDRRIAVQVTSNKRPAKVKSCLKAFMEKELFKDYDELYIYILTSKQNTGYNVEPISKQNFSFDHKKHILDKADVLSKLQGLENSTEIREVIEMLNTEVKAKIGISSQPNEVVTIINLISLLSEQEVDSTFDESSEIDPKNKIEKRYPENFEEIEDTYMDLCIQYSEVLDAIKSNNDVSSVKESKVALYLRNKSRNLLSKHNNNASIAFAELTNEVVSMFDKSSAAYDEMAIQYYLYKQLTECNVFPLPRRR